MGKSKDNANSPKTGTLVIGLGAGGVERRALKTSGDLGRRAYLAVLAIPGGPVNMSTEDVGFLAEMLIGEIRTGCRCPVAQAIYERGIIIKRRQGR